MVELSELEKLEKANAINNVLSKRIVKQKGGIFDQLEDDIRSFLRREMSNIFNEGRETAPTLSLEEVTIVKAFCQRLKKAVWLAKYSPFTSSIASHC